MDEIVIFLNSLIPYLDWFFDLFKYDWIPILLSLILLILGLLVFIFYFLIRSRKLRKELDDINSYIKRIFNKDKTNSKEILYDSFPALEQKFLKLNTLTHAWEEFDETLLKPREQGLIKNTILPSNFFNEELIEGQFSQRTMMGWPNIFVALGLLFTFIGLVAALKTTASAFDKTILLDEDEQIIITKDSLENELNKLIEYKGGKIELILQTPEESNITWSIENNFQRNNLLKIFNDGSIEVALENLLKVATFKFVTSVVGIFISIFLVLSFRRIIGNLNNKIRLLCSQLESMLEFQPAESIQERIFTELQRQTYPIEKFAEDLGTAIGQKMQPIGESIDKLADKLSSLNQEGLNDMIEKFFKGASGETKDMMANLTDKLNDVGEKVASMTTGMSQSGENFTSKVTDSTEKLQNVINELSDKLGEQSRIISDFSTSTQNVSTSLDSTASGFTQTADKLEEVSGKMENTFTSLENSIAELTNFRENLANLVEQINQSTEAIQSAWTIYEERFKDVDTNLVNAGQQFAEVIVANQKNSQDHIKDAAEAMDKGVTSLRGVIEELNNTIGEFKEELENNKPTDNQAN